MIEPGMELKWVDVEPSQNSFNFGPADSMVGFARQHGQKVRGHNLAWDVGNPGWLSAYSGNGSALQGILVNHIRNVMGHYVQNYPGTVVTWDVVNEPLGNSDNTVASRGSVWSAIGSSPEDYIKVAFQTARSVDPHAVLCLNDYPDNYQARWDGDFDLVSRLKSQGVPIDCFGDQMHTGQYPWGNDLPTHDMLVQNFTRFASIGVQIQITEADFAQPSGQANVNFAAGEWQVELQACLDAPNCTVFNLWDFSDKYSDISTDYPGPGYSPLNAYDWNLQPTAVFNTFLGVLSR